MGLFDKIGDLAGQNADKVEGAIEQVGDFIDDKTGGKFADKVDQAQEFAKDQLGKISKKEEQQQEDKPAE